jgi:TfoX/Sxy family transcriptional regulator of competence genes
MAEPYLSDLEAIVARVCAPQGAAGDIACRHFFSGAAAYVDGRVFMSLTPVGLALKLSRDDRALAFDQGATALRYFPSAPVKKDYAVLPARLVDDDGILRGWILRSITHVQS